MDYELWDFWLKLFLGSWAVLSTIFGVWMARTRATRSAIESLGSDVSRLRVDFHKLEVEVKNRPNHEDIGKLYEGLNKLGREMSTMTGEMKSMVRGFERVNTHLLKEG